MDKSTPKKARTAKSRSPKGKTKLKLQQQSKQSEAKPQPEYIKLSPISDDKEESQGPSQSPPLSPSTEHALNNMMGIMGSFAKANTCLNPVLLEDINYTNSSPTGDSNKFKRKIVVTSYQPQLTLAQPTIVSHTIVKPRTTTSLPVPVVQQAQLPVQQAQQPPVQQVQVSVHQPAARQPPIAHQAPAVQPAPVVQPAPPQEEPFKKRQRIMNQIFSADFDCISELVINNQDNKIVLKIKVEIIKKALFTRPKTNNIRFHFSPSSPHDPQPTSTETHALSQPWDYHPKLGISQSNPTPKP